MASSNPFAGPLWNDQEAGHTTIAVSTSASYGPDRPVEFCSLCNNTLGSDTIRYVMGGSTTLGLSDVTIAGMGNLLPAGQPVYVPVTNLNQLGFIAGGATTVGVNYGKKRGT